MKRRAFTIAIAIALGLSITEAQTVRAPLPDDRVVWNRTFAEMLRDQEFKPNAFLARIIEGKRAGTALDIAMGQGRNALMLAERGWDVTGFDISDLAIKTAQDTAQKRGLKLNAMVADLKAFEYGVERYDLVAAIYANAFVRRAADVVRSMKPGGLLVVEGFHRDTFGGGFETNELLKFFPNLTVLYYEDGIGHPDMTWDDFGKEVRFVRLVARKDTKK